MTAISDSLTYPKHERAARAIEQELELEPVPSVLVKDRDTPRPERRPRDYEGFRAQQSGIDPQEVKAEVAAIWNAADSGLAFRAALEDAGYILAKGDRRDFVIVDSAGDEHSLARRISGVKAAEIRARLNDIDRDGLPGVDEAREQARAETDEGSKPTSTDTGEREQPPHSPLDAQQAAHFLIEPDTRLEGTELAARFGDGFAPSKPGAQSRANESIPGARATDAADGGDTAALVEVIRSHAAGEHPQRVTPWSFAGLAERLTRYADLFRDFLQDEQSGERRELRAVQEPEAQPEPAAPAEPEAPRGWAARILEAGKHALHGLKHHDSHELREGVEEAAAIARDLLRRKETPPPDEPKRDMARPGGGNVEPPEPDAEPRAGPQAAAKEAAPVSPPVHLERFASRARGHEADDDHAPNLGRFQTRTVAAQTPPPQATPEPESPEPDFD